MVPRWFLSEKQACAAAHLFESRHSGWMSFGIQKVASGMVPGEYPLILVDPTPPNDLTIEKLKALMPGLQKEHRIVGIYC